MPPRSIEPPPDRHAPAAAPAEAPAPGEALLGGPLETPLPSAQALAQGPYSLAPTPPASEPDDPSAVQRRPAIHPVAHSFPPEDVPPAPPVGFSVSSVPAPLETAPMPARPRSSAWIAAVILLVALALAAVLAFGTGELPSPAPASPHGAASAVPPPSPSPPSAPAPDPSEPEPAEPAPGPSAPSGAASSDPGPAVLPAAPIPPEAPPPSEPPAVPLPEEPAPPRTGDAPELAAEGAASTAPNRGNADALIEAGDAALAAGDASRALALFERAIALNSHDPYGHAGAARACLALDRAEDAVRFAERAVAHRRRRASFRVLLGDALAAAGDAARARASWEEALELDPDDRAARERLGR